MRGGDLLEQRQRLLRLVQGEVREPDVVVHVGLRRCRLAGLAEQVEGVVGGPAVERQRAQTQHLSDVAAGQLGRLAQRLGRLAVAAQGAQGEAEAKGRLGGLRIEPNQRFEG